MYNNGKNTISGVPTHFKVDVADGAEVRRQTLKTIVFFMILFPYIRQRTLDELPHIVGLVYSLWLVCSASLVYLLAISLRKNVRLGHELGLFVAFWAFYIATTIANKPTSLMFVLRKVYCLFAIVLFIFLFADDLPQIMRVLAFIYGAFIVLELATDVILPRGLYQTYSYHTAHLLGDDNAIINVTQPGIAVMMAASKERDTKIPLFPMLLETLLVIGFIRMEAASSLITSALFILLLAYVYLVGTPNRLFLQGIVLSVIAVCIFGLSNPSVQRIITDVFHKSVTLSGRTIIWAQAVDFIRERPLFGYGGYYQIGRFWFNMTRAYSSHTPYLQMLIDGGIALFAVFFAIVDKALRQLDRNNDRFLAILACGLVAMMVNYITEQTEFYHLFIIVAVMIVHGRNSRISAASDGKQVSE